MELRALIRLASEIIAYYWPMRTFDHHNPLHGLEIHPFDKAAGRALQWLGGKGYLSSEIFRDYVCSGRILPHHLDHALKLVALKQSVKLGARVVTQFEILRACLVQDVDAPADEALDSRIQLHPDRTAITGLAERLASILERPAVQRNPAAEIPGRRATLAAWC